MIILGGYEWADSGGLKRNYGPTMHHIIFKMINPDTRNGVSNLKYQSGKSTLDKFGNNAKDLLDDMSSNYSIIIEKAELHEYYSCHIFRSLLPGTKSTFNDFYLNYDL